MNDAALAFLVGSPGYSELFLVFLAVLVLFGPKSLPGIARKLGRVMDELRRASQDFRGHVMDIDDVEVSAPSSGSELSADGPVHGERPSSLSQVDDDRVQAEPGDGTPDAERAAPGAEGHHDELAG